MKEGLGNFQLKKSKLHDGRLLDETLQKKTSFYPSYSEQHDSPEKSEDDDETNKKNDDSDTSITVSEFDKSSIMVEKNGRSEPREQEISN